MQKLMTEGFGQLDVLVPGTPVELGNIVRECSSRGRAVYPVGGGTQLHRGLPPRLPGVVVRTRALSSVIDYPARDMTITVQAGISIVELQRILAQENQWLPVEFAGGEGVTLGGALGTNRSGARRLGYGTLRDYVIGITFIDDHGQEIHGGGRVVKNVAGYDLMKLQIGALGTLGIITQVTLKVKPKPESSALIVWGTNEESLATLADQLQNSRPMAIELLNSHAARQAGLNTDQPWCVVCGFEEKRVTVDWQVETFKKEITKDLTIYRDQETLPIWAKLTEVQAAIDGEVGIKLNTLPSQLLKVLTSINAKFPELLISSHFGNGICHIRGVMSRPLLDSLLAHLDLLNLSTSGGAYQIIRCPQEWKDQKLLSSGINPANADLIQSIRNQLDPKRIFNPRFVNTGE